MDNINQKRRRSRNPHKILSSRSAYRAREAEADFKRDAMMKTVFAQIIICVLLIVFAFIYKSFGGAGYEALREQFSKIIDTKGDFMGVQTIIDRITASYPPEGQSSTAGSSSPLDILKDNIKKAQNGDYITEQQSAGGYGKAAGAIEVLLDPDTMLLGSGGASEEGLSIPSDVLTAPVYITDKPLVPVSRGTVTSLFGFRINPITGRAEFHTGVDIASPQGAFICSVLYGRVNEIGVSDIYGNYIVIDHGAGLATMYAHCDEILAPLGAVIRKGEIIAKVGSTGYSTGPHLHLEFIYGGRKFDPAWVYAEF